MTSEQIYHLQLTIGVGVLTITSALVGINIALTRIAVALEKNQK